MQNEQILFFSGWGMDNHTLPESLSKKQCLVCHSYHTSSFTTDVLNKVDATRPVTVIAWSWGVMMAEKLLAERLFPIKEAIAINGTPLAVDDLYGIPSRVAQLTLRSMNEQARENFFLRMCGDEGTLKRFKSMKPLRPIEEVCEELRFLVETRGAETISLPWTRAYIGRRDRIIPPENQKRYWAERSPDTEIIELADTPHFTFGPYE